jgi:hypothetical protein
MKNAERRPVDPNLGKENFGGIGNPDTEWAQDLTRPASKSEIEDAAWEKTIKATKERIAEEDRAPLIEDEAALKELRLRELKPGEHADGDWDPVTAIEALRIKREQGGFLGWIKAKLKGDQNNNTRPQK